MRMILIAAVLCFLFSMTDGFLPGFKLPIWPGAICKRNACKTSNDCKGKLKYCSKFIFCKGNKVCLAKPKVATTTTMATTTTTKPTTKPKPKYPCPYPLENVLARIDCRRAPKKNTICTVSCKADRCHVGSTITRCACDGGKCKWTRDIDSFCKKKKNKDICQNGGGCKPGYSCVPVGCSKICKKVCKDSCKTNANCPSGKACRTTSCGKKCKPIAVPQCPIPCKMGSCQIGYICRKAKPSCLTECVKIKAMPCSKPCKLGDDKSCPAEHTCVNAASPCLSKCVRKTVNLDLPKCPMFHPMSRMPRNVTEFCGTEPLSCKSDTDCGSDAVCCNSALCKRMMCSKKENKCPPKLTKRCTTNKDCENAKDVCIYNIGAEECKTCVKGFHCLRSAKSCREDKECIAPLKCMAGENGCLSCKSEIDTNPPTPPPPPHCIRNYCSSDNECPIGRKCKLDAIGCKKCQLPIEDRPPPSCKGQKCTTNAQCISGKCATIDRNCKVCLPALPPTDCDIRKRCITNSNCKEGEKCFTKPSGCKICVGLRD